jgi:hypothetical protein
MKRNYLALLFISALFLPLNSFAKTHKIVFDVPCNTLWPAVKDTLRNSGKYGILGISDSEQTASYIIGGSLTGKRINSLVLNPKSSGCELQIQTAYSGFVNNDAGDLKKRVTDSLAKLEGSKPVSAASDSPGKK